MKKKKLLLVLTVVVLVSLLFVGCLPKKNTAPVFTSTPGLTATVGILYSYTPAATDAEGDTVTFSVAPAVMAISGGVITWTPTAADVGNFAVVVTATDTKDATTQPYTIVVSAAPVPPVPPVAPIIAAIPDQEVAWDAADAAPWTYTVVVAPGTGTITDWELWGQPATMGIAYATATTALITWTNIAPAPAVYEITVWVEASDGEFDWETFVIEVIEPVVPDFVDTIVYQATHSYDDGTTQYVRSGAVTVTVTLLEALVAGESLDIRWNDGTTEGAWTDLTLTAGTTLVYTASLNFNGTWDDCMLVCVEVAKKSDCCPDELFTDIVKVDEDAPELSLDITFEDCGDCLDDPGAYFTFAPESDGECPPIDCCGDDCSGIAGWEIADGAACPECTTVTGTNCVAGTFACECLLYADSGKTVSYVLDFSFTDNVGNEITDEWTITLDTDSVTAFANTNTAVVDFVVADQTVNIPYTTCGD